MPTNINNFVVFGAIEQKWLALNAAQGALGLPTGNEAPTFDGVGRAQDFQGGVVAWHPNTGAQAVWGAIGARWLAIGRERYGYPITDELGCGDAVGRFNHFRALHLAGTPDSSIYWSPSSGACEIYGAIRDKWAELGWELGPAGYPVEPEHDQNGGGRTQRFQRAVITWSGTAGTAEHEATNDSATFESGPITSNLPLGGRVQLVVQRDGQFTFSGFAHDSGFDNIDYGIVAVLMTAAGTAITFERAGHVEGTIAGLPFGTPRRQDNFTVPGSHPTIAAEWEDILESGRLLAPTMTGQDKLVGALGDLLEEAAREAGAAAVKAIVALAA
jgi:hypothetical protein